MTRILLGCTLPGRYPRWGYPDRLETNEAMPRACVTASAVLGLLGLSVLLLQSFWPVEAPAPAALRVSNAQVIIPLPKPLPPPTIRVTPVQQTFPIAPRPSAAPVLVDESLAQQDEFSESSQAGAGGIGDGDASIETIAEGGEWSIVIESPSLPGPDDFVAVEHEPELLFMPEPRYPELARDAGIEGTVLVRALVAADGSVQETLLLQSVTGLDEAALEAVAGAAFRPARQQERPVAVWVVVPIQFSLRPRCK